MWECLLLWCEFLVEVFTGVAFINATDKTSPTVQVKNHRKIVQGARWKGVPVLRTGMHS